MAQKRKDLIGVRFGNLTVINYGKVLEKDGKKNRYYYECKCDCGKIKTIRGDALKAGQKTCGCIFSKQPTGYKHGYSRTRLYRVFRDMKTRCYNRNSPDYKNYGGRGICICSEWLNDYLSFKSWAEKNGYNEKAPKMQCTIDRIDVNGNYEPTNCRWVSIAIQNKNRRNTKGD